LNFLRIPWASRLHSPRHMEKPRRLPILLATESMPELRARARTALDKSDPSLEADCLLELSADTQPGVRLLHRPTGLEANAGPRGNRERTRLVALVRLRDRLYDVIQGRNKRGPRKRLKPK
jgi:hypothetical protein